MFFKKYFSRKEFIYGSSVKPRTKSKSTRKYRIGLFRSKKINSNPNDYEDLIQIGMIGLIKAVRTFDESRKVQFSTYATRCISNEIYMYYRKNNKYLADISLESTITTDAEENELKVEGVLCDQSSSAFIDKIEKTENIKEAINIILNCFPTKEKIILMLLIGGVTQKSIAKHVKLSQSYISRMEKKLYKRLKDYMSNEKNIMKEVFSVTMMDGRFQIAFSTTDTVKFNKTFANFLLKYGNHEIMQDLKVSCMNGKVIMYLIAEPESFVLIAEILQEVENFNFEIRNESFC